MEDWILYEKREKPPVRLDRLLKNLSRKIDIRLARQRADGERACPFIQKGSLFITARGDAAPCPELAYTHRARYFGNERVHGRYLLGNILDRSIEQIWDSEEYIELRKQFLYYDFPDCSYCYRPDLCYHRTAEGRDCFHNPTPCGECLWSKGIVICP
jgi:MoaA/NifB/PqqE/SkfB family radical SAM enzyme